jgi:hypothetical protein
MASKKRVAKKTSKPAKRKPAAPRRKRVVAASKPPAGPNLRTSDNFFAMFTVRDSARPLAAEAGVLVNNNPCLIALESDELFTSKGLTALRDLQESLAQTEGVDRVTSLYDIRKPVLRGVYRQMFPSDLADAEKIAEFRDLVAKHPMVKDQLLSADGRSTLDDFFAAAGQRMGYGEAAAKVSLSRPVDVTAKRKSPAEQKIIGTSYPRTDIPAKVFGQQVFIHDLRPAGMVRPSGEIYIVVARPTSHSSRFGEISGRLRGAGILLVAHFAAARVRRKHNGRIIIYTPLKTDDLIGFARLDTRQLRAHVDFMDHHGQVDGIA